MFVTVTVVIIVLLHYFVIHPLFFSPLSKIPGPLHLKLSKWFILNKARTESRNVYLQKLHEKYGDVVQIGPNEVAFNSLEYMKQIYMGNFSKEFKSNGIGFYAQFGNFGSKNSFSTGDSQVHLEKKRNIVKVYSKTNVLQSGDYIKQKVDQLWTPLDVRLQHPINVYPMFLALAMDVVSGFEYGGQFSTNFVSKINAGAAGLSSTEKAPEDISQESSLERNPKELFEGFQESSSMWFYTTLAPQLWNIVARIYGIGKKSSRAQQWIYSRFQQALKSKQLYQGPAPVSNVLQTMFQEMQTKPKHNLNEIASEIADHIAAGHETTGITLTYICWELSRPCNQHWQQKLHEECSGITDLQDLDQLPILHSVVQEACRIHSAIPGSEPRYVPEEAKFAAVLHDSTHTRVPIPPGTIVSCQPWSLHQLENPFGNHTAQFRPQRWLQDIENNESVQEYERRLKRMNNSMFTFGQGNRMCLGMHLALIEMKYCIAQMYSRYETKISPEWCRSVYKGDDANVLMGTAPSRSTTDLDMMRMADTYTTRPIRDECWLEFKSRDTINASG